ncbi:unnamed protein product [Penicillium bialowiezense]
MAPQSSFRCNGCDRSFLSQFARLQHMRDKKHSDFCLSCNRQFDNPTNYRAHIHSKIHCGTNVACEYCEESFVTASGALHHLERGCCPNSNTNCDALAREIQRLDIDNILTNIGELDRGSWECSLCWRRFRDRFALLSHFNSPAHDPMPYHCIKPHCDKYFVNLGALFQHLESESCGIAKFYDVPNYYRRLTDAVDNGEQITWDDFGF